MGGRSHTFVLSALGLAIGDTLALCPPLVISETEIAELLKRLRTALDETAATLSRV